MAAKYFAVFCRDKVMDSLTIFQRRPVKVGIELNSLSFKVSHMMPRGVDKQSMSIMQHVNYMASAE